MITLDDANALADVAKSLANLRRLYDRTAAMLTRAKQSAAPDADEIGRLDFELRHLEHMIGKQIGEVHAAAVNAGVADLRPARAYAPVAVKAGPFTTYTYQPARPRAMLIGGRRYVVDTSFAPDLAARICEAAAKGGA